ncbi:hypothetical protein ACFLX1_02080 [Chloroflexota bacterium]
MVGFGKISISIAMGVLTLPRIIKLAAIITAKNETTPNIFRLIAFLLLLLFLCTGELIMTCPHKGYHFLS